MTLHCDRFGLPLSTSSEAAAAAYREGIDLLLSAWPGADAAFDRAIAADPEFALAHIARARIHATYVQTAAAKARIASARALAAQSGTERERSHIEALALGMEGQPVKSLSITLAHLEKWPRDAMILSLPLGAFGLFAFSGMADHDQARVDLCQRLAPHYGDDWWFGTYLGWAHTENGDVVTGRDLTQRALDQRPANANAAHALAHAMFEDGSAADADAFIADWLPTYDRRGILYAHINWHRALIALEHDDYRRALAIYTDTLRPAVSAAFPLNIMSDCASLLWRCHLSGHEVPTHLWPEIASYAGQAFPSPGNAFVELHMAIAAAATGNRLGLDHRLAALEQRLSEGKLPAGPVVPALYRAMRAFADDKFAECVRLLEPVASEVVRIGGSHAQREIVEDMLLVAFLKSGENAKALAILDQRLHRRQSARDTRWRAQALRHSSASQ